MDLSAYTAAQLQTTMALLTVAMAEGLDLVGLHALLGARVAAAAPAPVQVARPASGTGQAGAPCPSCGRAVLAPVANRDGLRILGCRLCRYSEVVP